MNHPHASVTLLTLAHLYVHWRSASAADEAVEECLRRLLEDELARGHALALANSSRPPHHHSFN